MTPARETRLQIPVLGLGTYHSTPSSPSSSSSPHSEHSQAGQEVRQAVSTALRCGYRLFDAAYTYRNEQHVGRALTEAVQEGLVLRKDLFVISKLPMIGMRAGSVEKFLRRTLTDLALDRVDLYLIHSPVGCLEQSEDLLPMKDGKLLIDVSTDHVSVWKAMERLVDIGLADSIGLSNFSVKQASKIIANARIRPAVLQVELHVYFQQREMHEFCEQNNIVLMSYGSLGSMGRMAMCQSLGLENRLPNPLDDPVVKLVAKKHDRSSSQILLKFLIQQNIVVIPKSVNADRIRENANIFNFHLDQLDIEALKSLDRGEDGRTFRFGKDIPGFQDHPEAWM